MSRPGRLAERRALLVGAGSGIGRAVADAFADEGAAVAILERNPDKCAELDSAGLPTLFAKAVKAIGSTG